MKFYFIIFLISVSAGAATLQHVQGEIVSGQTGQVHLIAELQDSLHQQPVERTLVGLNGAFDFRNIEEGDYEIRILTEQGELLKREQVTVHGMVGSISIVINVPRAERPANGQISIARLQHKVPRKARKEYEKAHSLMDAHDVAGSLAHLENAVALDPGYTEAFNDLGCRYFDLGRTADALSAFRHALELDPDSGLTYSNLALALMQINDLKGAEAAARKGLALNPTSDKSHYILGATLFVQHKLTNEALVHLRRASDSFPQARILADKVMGAVGSVPGGRPGLVSTLK